MSQITLSRLYWRRLPAAVLRSCDRKVVVTRPCLTDTGPPAEAGAGKAATPAVPVPETHGTAGYDGQK